ncbi:MAG: RAMP superfamily CRISPR-associated protein [Cyanobacteria bacterium P01_E01_bin.42]
MNLTYLYLLSPLHTGGTSQEGNVVGIARETHTKLPYLPSSTIRGRLRASVGLDDFIRLQALKEERNNARLSNQTERVEQLDADIGKVEETCIQSRIIKVQLFGPELKDLQDKEFIELYELQTGYKLTQLEQGAIWIGDGSILWFPVASLSHGVVWVSSPLLLQRWQRFCRPTASSVTEIPEYSSNLNQAIYLKDAQITGGQLKQWNDFADYIPNGYDTSIENVLVLPNQHCEILIQMSLWRQVKVKLNDHKVVTDGSFRYEEAIPSDSLMYFTWGTVRQTPNAKQAKQDFQDLLNQNSILQLGGQESLGRGFVRQWNQERLPSKPTNDEEVAV